ncbi:(2Fe-2S)-binding protein [Nitriliruptor alkaliphilus]|uniref:(2Fe-2S)-binding protein n=1 Tax=Nitriliruptor alkaliphilus TaxID=427918 RepID=UPI000697A3AB|nr:(2Fe-2S)-binding protein [Nitriliruptor alkaliphilus]
MHAAAPRERHRVDARVNGTSVTRKVQARLMLVRLLREELGLTGAHIGCDTTQCGACTVLLDDVAVKSCTVLAVQADGRAVTTIEGVADGSSLTSDEALHPVQQAFWAHHGLQCGYCTPGMVMSLIELLADEPDPTEEDIREGLIGNLCRCTGYQNIVDAALAAAAILRGEFAGSEG